MCLKDVPNYLCWQFTNWLKKMSIRMKMPQVVYLVLPPEKMTKYGKHRSAPRVWLVARSNQAWLAPVSQAPHSLVMYMQHGIVWMRVRLEPGHPQMMFGCPYVLQHSKVTCKLVCLISCMHARFSHLLHLVVRIPLSRSWDGSNYIQLQVTNIFQIKTITMLKHQ
jgi:hypothetical protein